MKNFILTISIVFALCGIAQTANLANNIEKYKDCTWDSKENYDYYYCERKFL